MESIEMLYSLIFASLLLRPAVGGGIRPAVDSAVPPAVGGGMNLPISYNLPNDSNSCLYERVLSKNEHLSASVFIVSGEMLRAAFVLEGPVAPVDVDLYKTDKAKGGPGGRDLQDYLTRYEKEGPDMFVSWKADGMSNVKPVRIAELLDFEEEEEDYLDDVTITDLERADFNAKHDVEHQHVQHEPPQDGQHGRREPEEGDPYYDDNVRQTRAARAEATRRQIEEEVEVDDDFVKLQMDNVKPAPSPRRPEEEQPRHRRLQEMKKLIAGEPYQRTIEVESPGWYRVCVFSNIYELEVEMELRKGRLDRRTGHVRSLEEVEIHSEIHNLYEKEDDVGILAEEEAIKDEDLKVTKEQIRVLETVYGQIMTKQLENRRTWDWRTIKNQHLYSHLVLGNLVETIVYMAVTGFQVYTIRKWFMSGQPALGR